MFLFNSWKFSFSHFSNIDFIPLSKTIWMVEIPPNVRVDEVTLSSSASLYQGCVTPRTTATLRPRQRAPWRSSTAQSLRCSAPSLKATHRSTWWSCPSPSRRSSPITRTWCPSWSLSTTSTRTCLCLATASTPATIPKVTPGFYFRSQKQNVFHTLATSLIHSNWYRENNYSQEVGDWVFDVN